MPERDPRARVTQAFEQQREAFEDTVERMRKRGREVAEGIADALRRMAPGDDSRGAIERLEEQQREILTRLADAQREGFQRLIEANEAFWRQVQTMVAEGGPARGRGARARGEVTAERAAPAPTTAAAAPVAPATPAPATKKASATKKTAAARKAPGAAKPAVTKKAAVAKKAVPPAAKVAPAKKATKKPPT